MGRIKVKRKEIRTREQELDEYKESLTQTHYLSGDLELEEIIRRDIFEICSVELGQDKVYESFPVFSRVRRDKDYTRVYSFGAYGGIAIVYDKKNKTTRMVVLGEDDGNYFPRCANIYESCYGGKDQFTLILSEALSLWNNIKL